MTPFMVATSDFERIKSVARPEVFINLLFLGIFASAVCFATWNRSVEKLGATTTSKYLLHFAHHNAYRAVAVL